MTGLLPTKGNMSTPIPTTGDVASDTLHLCVRARPVGHPVSREAPSQTPEPRGPYRVLLNHPSSRCWQDI